MIVRKYVTCTIKTALGSVRVLALHPAWAAERQLSFFSQRCNHEHRVNFFFEVNYLSFVDTLQSDGYCARNTEISIQTRKTRNLLWNPSSHAYNQIKIQNK